MAGVGRRRESRHAHAQSHRRRTRPPRRTDAPPYRGRTGGNGHRRRPADAELRVVRRTQSAPQPEEPGAVGDSRRTRPGEYQRGVRAGRAGLQAGPPQPLGAPRHRRRRVRRRRSRAGEETDPGLRRPRNRYPICRFGSERRCGGAVAGGHVVDGDELDIAPVEDLEYGLVSEWIDGLDSLQSAMGDPEVVEEDEG
ncbi:DUF2150 family protein [Haloplanus salinus]|uniref:DUF2150 family protein n=1 Tax=Haloplanus salinus TaxID=1126245 RepID=A0A368NF03_9EURY|nr:DUF2150 family protein [Haloplanus salinus]